MTLNIQGQIIYMWHMTMENEYYTCDNENIQEQMTRNVILQMYKVRLLHIYMHIQTEIITITILQTLVAKQDPYSITQQENGRVTLSSCNACKQT